MTPNNSSDKPVYLSDKFSELLDENKSLKDKLAQAEADRDKWHQSFARADGNREALKIELRKEREVSAVLEACLEQFAKRVWETVTPYTARAALTEVRRLRDE